MKIKFIQKYLHFKLMIELVGAFKNMKRVKFFFSYILFIAIGSFLTINLLGLGGLARREAVNEVRPVIELAKQHIPLHFVRPVKLQSIPELRTHLSSSDISAAARFNHQRLQAGDVSNNQIEWYQPKNILSSGPKDATNEAIKWRLQQSPEIQEQLQRIYDEMGPRTKNTFKKMSPQGQIDYMQTLLRSADRVPSTEVDSNLFRPAAKKSAQGMLSSSMRTTSHLYRDAILQPGVLSKSFIEPKGRELPSQATADSGDPSGKAENLLKRIDLSKIENVNTQEVIAPKTSVVSKPFEVEKRVAEFKDVLSEQHVPSDILDVTLDGIKNYLVKSKDSGISESVAVKKVQEFLDFESEIADLGTDEIASREKEFGDVIVAVKQAFIDNFEKVVQGELQEINIQISSQDHVISDRQRQQLRNTKNFQDFMEQYEKVKRLAVDDLMLRKSEQFLDNISIDKPGKDLVHAALRTQLDVISNRESTIPDVWRHFSEYARGLETYFVKDPVGQSVDHRIDLPSDLARFINKWRINLFEAKVKEQLTRLNAPQKMIDMYMQNIRKELFAENISVKQSPSIVFDHIRTLWTDLMRVQSEDIAVEAARMEAEEAAAKSKAADRFEPVRKPADVPERSGRRVPSSSDTGAVQPSIARSTVAKRDITQKPTIEPAREKPKVVERQPLTTMPDTIAAKRTSRDILQRGSTDITSQETPKDNFTPESNPSEKINEVSRPDGLTQAGRRVPSSSDTGAVQVNLARSTVAKRDVTQNPTIEPAREKPKVVERQLLTTMPDTIASKRILSKDQHDIVKHQTLHLTPQNISTEDAQGVVQRIQQRNQMELAELASRDHLMRVEQETKKDLEQQMQKMMEDVYTGKQNELLTTESELRDKVEALQEKEAQKIHEMWQKDMITRREAELMLKQHEQILSNMVSAMFAQQVEEFESGKARLLTEQEEKRIQAAEEKLQQQLREIFELDADIIKNEQDIHRNIISADHETTLESIHALMAQEREEALAAQKAREQKEQEEKRIKDEQDTKRQIAKNEIIQKEEQDRQSAQDAYQATMDEFSRLQSTLLIMLQQLDRERIKTVQAESESRELLAQAQKRFLQTVDYTAETEALQKQYVQKMQDILDHESQKIFNNIHEQQQKLAREIDKKSQKSLYSNPVTSKAELKRSSKKSMHQKTATKKLALKIGQIQQAQGGSKEKEKQQAFLRNLEERIHDLVEGVENRLHHSEDYRDYDKDKKHPHHNHKLEPNDPTNKPDPRQKAKNDNHDHNGNSGDQHEPTDHHHGHDHSHEPKQSTAKEPKKTEPNSIVPSTVDAQLEQEFAQMGMNIARDMFDAKQEQVTPETILPWIDHNPEYAEIQEKEKKLSSSHEPKPVPYVAGYVQGCMQMIQCGDDVMQSQMDEVRDKGPEIAQELIDKNIDQISIQQLKEIVSKRAEFDLVDPRNPYAMKWAQGYIQGMMQQMKET